MIKQFVVAVVLITGLPLGISFCHAQSTVLDKIAVAGAPDNQKIFFQPLVKKLEAKQDINKQ